MQPDHSLGKILILIGVVAIVAGVLIIFKDQIPGMGRLGRLPGDIRIESKNVKIYFPLATSVLLSVLLSLLLWLFRR